MVKNFGELLAIRQFSQLSIELRMASDHTWRNIRPLVYGSIFSSSVSTSSLQYCSYYRMHFYNELTITCSLCHQALCHCSVPYRYSAHTRMGCPICIWAADMRTSPYAYGLPIRVRVAHIRVWAKTLASPICVYECPYAYRYVGPYKYSYSYDVGVATVSF